MDGHNKAFSFFGGVPKSILHDNIQGPMQAVFYTPVRTDHTSCFGGADH